MAYPLRHLRATSHVAARALVLLFAIPLVASDATLSTELAFDRAWGTYLLAKVGCPAPSAVSKTMHVEDCTLPKEIKYHEFDEARKLAMKVFNLHE